MRCVLIVCLAVAMMLPVAKAGELADRVLEGTAGRQNLYAVVGCTHSELPAELVAAGVTMLHALDGDAARVAAAREAGKDLRIDRLIVEQIALARLPYVDGLLDGLVAVDPPEGVLAGLSCDEVVRVLRPGGRAVVGYTRPDAEAALSRWAQALEQHGVCVARDDVGAWATITKAHPEGVDEWRHWEHGPDNNPVSTDQLIRAPYQTQWLADPYYIAMPAVTVISAGRNFTASGHIAHHRREEPWLNTLYARNGYNGFELWRKRLPDGYLVHRSAFVAMPDAFYMINTDGDGCLILDPDTGEERERIDVPEIAGAWKWMVLEDGVIYAMAGKRADPTETTLVRSPFPAWSWGELSDGYYADRVPWGFGETLFAYDLEARRLLWRHDEDAAIDSRALAMGGGGLFFYCPDARLGCLDVGTGEVRWRNEAEETRALIEESGQGLGSTPGFRTTAMCVYTPKGLYYQGQTRQNLVAVNPESGALMWHRSKTTNNPNVICADGCIYVGIGPEGSTLRLDPATGETLADLGFRKRSCVRLTATPDSFFVRGWVEGITRFDRASRKVYFDGAMRPACNDGVMAANGLLYIGPWPCDCGLSLMGTAALCTAAEVVPDPIGARLERVAREWTPAVNVGPEDWYNHRGGNDHAGSAEVAVGKRLLPLWVVEPDQPFEPTTPVTADGLALLAGSDGIVRAYDVRTGSIRWTYPTAGPILSSPTLWQGRALFGSGDGFVYAVDAASGDLLWRFRAAPEERRIMVYGHLASTWPVNTGVLVHDGVAYFAAGIIDYNQTYVYALDAETGALKWVNDSTGHLDADIRKGVSAQGNMTIADKRLWLAPGNIMPPSPFDLASGEYAGSMDIGTGASRAQRGEELGRFGGFLLSGGRLRYSARGNVVSPSSFLFSEGAAFRAVLSRSRVMAAWNGAQLVYLPEREAPPMAYDAKKLQRFLRKLKTSADRIDVDAAWCCDALAGSTTRALALAQDVAVAACESPMPRSRFFRHRLCLIRLEDGKLIADAETPGVARLNGVAIDREGRVLAVMEDGSLACFGGEEAFSAYMHALAAKAQADPSLLPKAKVILQGKFEEISGYRARKAVTEALDSLGLDAFDEARAAGAVRVWHLVGPVPWDSAHPLDAALIHEPKVDLSKTLRINREKCSWQRHDTADRKGMLDLAKVYGPHEAHAAYAYAEVDLPESGPYVLRIGTNDGFKCWFNGEEVGRFDGGRAYRADADTLAVSAKAGRNTILLKVTQMGGAWALGLRITDPEGAPVAFTQPEEN